MKVLINIATSTKRDTAGVRPNNGEKSRVMQHCMALIASHLAKLAKIVFFFRFSRWYARRVSGNIPVALSHMREMKDCTTISMHASPILSSNCHFAISQPGPKMAIANP